MSRVSWKLLLSAAAAWLLFFWKHSYFLGGRARRRLLIGFQSIVFLFIYQSPRYFLLSQLGSAFLRFERFSFTYVTSSCRSLQHLDVLSDHSSDLSWSAFGVSFLNDFFDVLISAFLFELFGSRSLIGSLYNLFYWLLLRPMACYLGCWSGHFLLHCLVRCRLLCLLGCLSCACCSLSHWCHRFSQALFVGCLFSFFLFGFLFFTLFDVLFELIVDGRLWFLSNSNIFRSCRRCFDNLLVASRLTAFVFFLLLLFLILWRFLSDKSSGIFGNWGWRWSSCIFTSR